MLGSKELRQPCPVLLPVQATWPTSWPCTTCHHSSSWQTFITFLGCPSSPGSCPRGVPSCHALPALQKALWFDGISSYLSAKPVRHSDVSVGLLLQKQPALLGCDCCGLWISGNCTLHPLVQKGHPRVNHFSRESLSDKSTSCPSDHVFSCVCKASLLPLKTMCLVSF